jgi:hypothetical protein
MMINFVPWWASVSPQLSRYYLGSFITHSAQTIEEKLRSAMIHILDDTSAWSLVKKLRISQDQRQAGVFIPTPKTLSNIDLSMPSEKVSTEWMSPFPANWKCSGSKLRAPALNSM